MGRDQATTSMLSGGGGGQGSSNHLLVERRGVGTDRSHPLTQVGGEAPNSPLPFAFPPVGSEIPVPAGAPGPVKLAGA